MRRVAQFEKISFEQFMRDYSGNLQDDEQSIQRAYDRIKLPARATKGSAGYDFFLPYDLELKPGDTVRIPTGVRVRIDENFVLKLYPRSGLGFKYKLYLDNTVGIIDSDYYFSDNEGHIQAKITNGTLEGRTLSLPAGSGFMQGIFVEFGITVDDSASAVRNGGFGSTGG